MDYAEMIVTGYRAGKELAAKSLEVGKKFLGAWGVAEELGYERDGMAWKGAEIGALEVFGGFDIYTDRAGMITCLEKKGA